jgi:hypothetical protein
VCGIRFTLLDSSLHGTIDNMANFKIVHDQERFNRWKEILDRFEAGELIDSTASKMLEDLRTKERAEFESCQREK